MTNNQCRFKLRIYYVQGARKGNFKEDEYFPDMFSLSVRYNELCQSPLYRKTPPTAWHYDEYSREWVRILGF